MSEFKFACPVCGQHITADPASSGSQLECPTCFRKIVVPQPPASAESKFILSASEANKPRPPQTQAGGLEPISKEPVRSSVPFWLIALVLAGCAAGATVFAMRDKIFKSKTGTLHSVAGSRKDSDDDSAPTAKTVAVPVVTNNVAWNLELANLDFPSDSAAGKIRGEFVSCNRSTLQPGSQGGKPVVGLGLRQLTRGLPDLSTTIYFFASQPEDLRGKSVVVSTNDALAPRVIVRWKEGKDTKSQTFNSGYALKVEFGDVAGNRLSGKAYLCLPDDAQSRVAGTFNAEIRKPAPPKSRPPKPAPAS